MKPKWQTVTTNSKGKCTTTSANKHHGNILEGPNLEHTENGTAR